MDKKFKSRKFNFAIIDKNPENIPGGVGYGFKTSQYGYFNNPIRLAPKIFIKWLSNKNVKEKIINYLKIYGGDIGKIWIKKNKSSLFSTKKSKFEELYIPRAIMNFWMEENLTCQILQIFYQH